MGNSVQTDCINVGKVMIPTRQYSDPPLRNKRPLLLVFVLVGLLTQYYIFSAKQWRGEFLCDKIYIQFGDEFSFQLAYFSGVFYQDHDHDRINVRASYVYASSSFQGTLRLAYCDTIGAWTISTGGECSKDSIYVSSSPTDTYDITSHRLDSWYFIHPQTGVRVPADRFVMACIDCDNSVFGNCAPEHGACIHNECVCNDDRFGLFCEYEQPCEILSQDERTAPLPAVMGVSLPTNNYELMRYSNGDLVQLNNKPVFISTTYFDERNQVGSMLLLFFGRRWAITFDMFLFHEFDPCWDNFVHLIEMHKSAFVQEAVTKCPPPSRDTLAEYLSQKFHPSESGSIRYIPFFFSSPMDFGTPSDGPAPVEVTWFRSQLKHFETNWQVDTSLPVETAMLCALCDNSSNPCKSFRQCNAETGNCDCPEYEYGALCEATRSCLESDGIGCYANGTCMDDGKCDCGFAGLGDLCQFAPT